MLNINDFNISLDSRQLKLFVSLMDTLSLTKTADELGVGQPAVSHSLNRLREQLGDQLFVRSGRGIKATPHAQNIRAQAQEVMRLMEGLAQDPVFDPANAKGEIVIGANEYQRDLLLPQLFETLSAEAPGLSLRIISNPLDPLGVIRDESVDLVLTPLPPSNKDLHCLQLNTDRQMIFYDANCREQPRTLEDFVNAEYVVPELIYDDATGFIDRDRSPVKGHNIKPKLVVNTFSGVRNFLRGSQMLAPMPGKMKSMSGFSYCHVEGTHVPLSLHLCWHQRNSQSSKHQWLIEQFKKISKDLVD